MQVMFVFAIMMIIVLAMALIDWATGFFKAYVKGIVSSNAMRIGGVKKLSELFVMLASIVLEVGLSILCQYYPDPNELLVTVTNLLGFSVALTVFLYLVVMEFISILENYVAINPDAKWAAKLAEKLSNIDI